MVISPYVGLVTLEVGPSANYEYEVCKLSYGLAHHRISAARTWSQLEVRKPLVKKNDHASETPDCLKLIRNHNVVHHCLTEFLDVSKNHICRDSVLR